MFFPIQKKSKRRKSRKRRSKSVKSKRRKSRRRRSKIRKSRRMRRSKRRKRSKRRRSVAKFSMGYDCEDDFITYEPIENPYVSIGDDQCVGCKVLEQYRKLNASEFDKNPLNIFGGGTKEQLISLKTQLKNKCNINLEKKESVILKKKEKTLWKGVEIILNPTQSEKTELIKNIKLNDPKPHICNKRINLTFISKSINRSTILIYSWDNTRDKKRIRSFICAYQLNKDELYIDTICSRERGDGYKLFQRLMGYARGNKYKKIYLTSVSEKTGKLIETYKRWGFTLTFSGCKDKCNMFINVLKDK